MAAASPNRILSRPLSSTHTGFLDLPIHLRNRIYRQVLAVPHPIFLFQDPRCPIESFAPEKPSQWISLLYTNRQVSKEAKAVLYSTNEFALEESTKRQGSLVKSFLNCFGPVNAGFLSYLRMDFPATERVDGQLGEIKKERWPTDFATPRTVHQLENTGNPRLRSELRSINRPRD